MFPTEFRRRVEMPAKDIFNIGDYVVNIKNLTISKEGINMLEMEKNFKLEQLKSLKENYENNLEAIKAQDVNVLVNERLATVKAEIESEVLADYNSKIAKATLKVEAVVEMIAEVEAIEVEAPVEEETIEVETPVAEEETVEVETPVDEFSNDISTEERPII